MRNVSTKQAESTKVRVMAHQPTCNDQGAIDPQGSRERSVEVTEFINAFLPITRDRMELETWDWHQCVRLDQAHHMTCQKVMT